MKNLIWVHMGLMVIAVILIVAAAVVARGRKDGWFKRHRRFALSGVLAALTAFLMIVLFKATLHYPHFKSPHAIAGVISLSFLVITPSAGWLVASGKNGLRPVHKGLGRITSVLVLLTAFMGLMRLLKLFKK